jgi:MHS family proline/betaine transporter-like MFS transporter
MQTVRRVILSCMVGNALEWYDFALFSYFATIIGQLFFPSADPLASLLMSYGAFAAGFLMRPLGAIAFGYIGDNIGRKPALMLSVYLMAIPTTLIGLLPTYASVGLWAPVLLTVCRLVQGFSMGGEFTGSMIFMTEYATDKNRGFIASFALFSAVGGVILGSACAVLITHFFDASFVQEWGWRIPFLLSCVGGLMGAYMRRTLAETPQYTAIKQSAHVASPIKALFTQHLDKVGLVMLLDFTLAIGFFTVLSFMPGYLSQVHGFVHANVLSIHTVNSMVLAGMTLFMGWLSDRVGKKRLLGLSALGLLCLAYPSFLMFEQGELVLAFLGQMILAILMGIYMGPIAAILVSIFPAPIRFSGLSLSHNLSMAIFGGTAPLVATYLIAETGNKASPAFYLMTAAVLSLLGLYIYKSRPLQQD